MGQYHKLVNLDKREQVISYGLGLGAKQYEQTGCEGSLAEAMYLLVMTSPARGGGDWKAFEGLSGRWAGDRVVILGDYTEDYDLPDYPNAGSLWQTSEHWADITEQVADALGEIWDFRIIKDPEGGWLNREKV